MRFFAQDYHFYNSNGLYIYSVSFGNSDSGIFGCHSNKESEFWLAYVGSSYDYHCYYDTGIFYLARAWFHTPKETPGLFCAESRATTYSAFDIGSLLTYHLPDSGPNAVLWQAGGYFGDRNRDNWNGVFYQSDVDFGNYVWSCSLIRLSCSQ